MEMEGNPGLAAACDGLRVQDLRGLVKLAAAKLGQPHLGAIHTPPSQILRHGLSKR
jgi:hypothetical protein